VSIKFRYNQGRMAMLSRRSANNIVWTGRGVVLASATVACAIVWAKNGSPPQHIASNAEIPHATQLNDSEEQARAVRNMALAESSSDQRSDAVRNLLETIALNLGGWDGEVVLDEREIAEGVPDGEGTHLTAYMGHVTIGNARRALIRVGDEQAFVRAGDKIGGLQVLEINEFELVIQDAEGIRRLARGRPEAKTALLQDLDSRRRVEGETSANMEALVGSNMGSNRYSPSLPGATPDDH
jgi:hypothetical protein